MISEKPLPEFLVEFNEQEDSLHSETERASRLEIFVVTFREAIVAVHASLLVIEKISHNAQGSLEEVFKEVLEPWLAMSREIFWFLDTDTRANFAVYLMRNTGTDTGKLTKEFRYCDKRIPQTNRKWEPGRGHVGICFAQGKTIFSPDIAVAEVSELLGADNPQDIAKDRENYRSLVSTPIMVNGSQKGVLVITSSKPDQFEKEIHQPIVEVIATLLAQSTKDSLIDDAVY
jgi:hypothetical protein